MLLEGDGGVTLGAAPIDQLGASGMANDFFATRPARLLPARCRHAALFSRRCARCGRRGCTRVPVCPLTLSKSPTVPPVATREEPTRCCSRRASGRGVLASGPLFPHPRGDSHCSRRRMRRRHAADRVLRAALIGVYCQHFAQAFHHDTSGASSHAIGRRHLITILSCTTCVKAWDVPAPV